MENLEKKELNKTRKRGKTSLNSNPINKVKIPVDGIEMISVPANSSETESTIICLKPKKSWIV